MKQKSSEKNVVIVAVMAAALLLAFLCSTFAVMLFRVVGNSMLPTLAPGNWVVVNRLAYKTHPPQTGDVITFQKQDITDEILIKRVIGTPLDTVQIKDGAVYVNDELLQNEEFGMGANFSMERIRVPEHCYFVMGDNRAESSDSTKWDQPFVAETDIIGQAVWMLFPKMQSID